MKLIKQDGNKHEEEEQKLKKMEIKTQNFGNKKFNLEKN